MKATRIVLLSATLLLGSLGSQAQAPPASTLVTTNTSSNYHDNNGRVDGRIRDSLSRRDIAGIEVMFYRVSFPGIPAQSVFSDGSGQYRVFLEPGSYIIKAQSSLSAGGSSYRPEWYPNASDSLQAQQIRIDNSSRMEADFDLVPTRTMTMVVIRGSVRDSAGTPLSGAMVAILRSIQDMDDHSSSGRDHPEDNSEHHEIEDLGHAHGIAWRGFTDSLGLYTAPVSAGRSYVALAVKPGFSPQFFDHQSNIMMASTLRLEHDTAGINFDLRAVSPINAYTVSGLVMDSTGIRVPSRIALIPLHHRFEDHPSSFAYTDSLGKFSVLHVRPGKYLALAIPFSLYVPAYFRAGSFGTAKWSMADTITVAGDVFGIDIGVKRMTAGGLAHMTGKITYSGAPIRGVNVFAAFQDGSIAAYGLTDDRGSYTLSGLPAERLLVTADLEGFQTTQTSVTIPAGVLAITGGDLALSATALTGAPTESLIPGSFTLTQNYPNPFNPSTTISYSLPVTSIVRLRLYNAIGQEVRDLFEGTVAAGSHDEVWNGKDAAGSQVASGVYFYRYRATPVSGGLSFQSTKKMLLMK